MRLWPRRQTLEPAPALTAETVAEIVRAEVNQSLDPYLQLSSAKPGWPYHLDQPHQFWLTFSPRRLPGKLWSVDALRLWADNFDPLRSAIEYIKAECASVPIKFVGKPETSETAVNAQIKLMNAFCADEGPLGFDTTRRVFEAKMFEDALIVGAYAVWNQYTRGGLLLGCDAIDAATVKPMVDTRGWPDPKTPFQQWVIGVLVATFAPGELRYDGMFPRTDTPYFKSPIEYCVSRITAGLKLDEWNLTWLTEGNVRTGDTIALPGEWSPEQVIQFSDWWEAKSKSVGARQGTTFLPSGSSKISDHSRKDQDFAEYEVQVIRRICSLFGIMPASIGYVGEQYKVTQGDSMDHSRRVGVGRVLAMRKEYYDDLCHRMGCPDIECNNVDDDLDERAAEIKSAVEACGGPVLTPNEARAQLGLPPKPHGDELREANQLPVDAQDPKKSDPRPDPKKDPKKDENRIEAIDDDEMVVRADDDVIGWFKRDGRNIPITEKSGFGRMVRQSTKLHNENEGSTWSLTQGDMGGTKNWVVSIYREFEFSLPERELNEATVAAFVSKYREELKRPKHVLGLWWEEEDGHSYMDVCVLVSTEEEAMKLGFEHEQIAVFNLEDFTTHATGYDREKNNG